MSDADTTRQFSDEGDQRPEGRTLNDLFFLVESLGGEFTEFRDKVEVRLLRTTPLSETLETVRGNVAAVAEHQDTLRNDVAEIAKVIAEIAKGSRRIESKVNGISIDFSEIKGTLQNHEVRLQALNSE